MVADAVAALDRGDPVGALDHLLTVWGSARDAGLGQRILRIGKILGSELAPLDDGSACEEGDWLVLASHGRSVDMDRLIATFDEGRSRVIAARLDRLCDRPPDPRATGPVLAFAEGLPFSSSAARRVWTAWFRYARHLADPQMADGIRRMIDAADARLNIDDPPRWLEFEHFLLNRLRPLLAALPGAHEVGPMAVLDRAIDRLAHVGPPPVAALLTEPATPIRALFSQILDFPEAQDTVHVWADALSEKSDPRGEFTAIQLIRETRPLKRQEREQERRLQRRHGNRWLGPLDAVVNSGTARFRRGLLEAALVQVQSQAQRALLDRPEWRTVRILQSTTPHLLSGVPAQVERVGMRMLPDDDGEVRGPPGFTLLDVKPPTWTQFTELARSRTPSRFRALCTALPGTPSAAHIAALDDLRGLPELEELHLTDTARWYRRDPTEVGQARLGALVDSGLLEGLHRLVLDGITPVPQAPDAMWWQNARPNELVLIGSGPWVRSYRFSADGVHAAISKLGPASFVTGGTTAGLRTLQRTLQVYLGDPSQYASVTIRSRPLPEAELDLFQEVLSACPVVTLPRKRRRTAGSP